MCIICLSSTFIKLSLWIVLKLQHWKIIGCKKNKACLIILQYLAIKDNILHDIIKLEFWHSNVPMLLGVNECCCTSCALWCREGWPYPASRCWYVGVSVDGHIPHPSSSTLEEYHILRVVSLVTSENLILGRFSDKNILLL